MRKNLDARLLRDWAARILMGCGMCDSDADLAADVLVRTDLRGYGTHGLVRLGAYWERLRDGSFNARAAMRHTVVPGGIVLDADGAMGQLAATRAIELGLDALNDVASVLVSVRECGHLGALGVYALQAAEAGAICMLGQRTPPMLSMPGFARPAIGHNPIAFGCPVPDSDPLILDIACSVAARGHILRAAREGRAIPSDWAVDEDGLPTTDADRALKGALLPMGGHKGLGIAMMMECLAGALSGASADQRKNELTHSGAGGRQGAFCWLVKPGAFIAQDVFFDGMAQWTRNYQDLGGEKARVPGSRGAKNERHMLSHGLELPESVIADLFKLAQATGIAFPQ